MKILAIETSADDTAAAVVENTTILSSVKNTQLGHADWGGILPSLAKRDHEHNIDSVINKSLLEAGLNISDVDAIAVTSGPGLAIALEVGIAKAKALATKYKKPLIAVNHIEGHLLSPLASPNLQSLISNFYFPILGLVVSGGHTELILIEEIGKYKILAETLDDALGEAIDKAGRMLGMPYPAGPVFEKAAALGNPKKYLLPLPMAGKEDRNELSYSGLKAAFGRLVKEVGTENINDLAASFQNRAFEHLIRIIKKSIEHFSLSTEHLLVGGGVIANQELRKRLTKLGEELGIAVHFAPMEFTGDNAAMIGIAASFKYSKGLFVKDFDSLDRLPRWRIDQML
ncbi:MAG: tRNA (adenosine(37)-N6)-threonylcarbamoyltransferase complex transferase subunit TsaD, partial [Candidatus Amesbacteria bacterium]|nr:tRNA (adenosine(37)-N6)-threonylcarbamoyltransferase complex transferase subunit TsaD [Candidatus Amesbacteria bacterium]